MDENNSNENIDQENKFQEEKTESENNIEINNTANTTKEIKNTSKEVKYVEKKDKKTRKGDKEIVVEYRKPSIFTSVLLILIGCMIATIVWLLIYIFKVNKEVVIYEEPKENVVQEVDETSKEDGQDNTNIMYETLRNELKSIIPNTKELTNIMIDMAYRTKKISVIYLWNMFGVEILDNMLINSNYKIKYPVLNEEEKEFEYEGYGFKMEEKNIRRYLG